VRVLVKWCLFGGLVGKLCVESLKTVGVFVFIGDWQWKCEYVSNLLECCGRLVGYFMRFVG